jgi:hypothetical protein
VKTWTRTLNLDDAHTLLALAEPGRSKSDWTAACHQALPDLSVARRRELIRLLREGFLEWTDDDAIAEGLFLKVYANAPASGQIDLVGVQWALSHDLTLTAVKALVAPALHSGELQITLQRVEELVQRSVNTDSAESLRKTRTVLLGALEGLGTLSTRGTGQHRSLAATRGRPHPIAFGYLVLRDLKERGVDGMMASEVPENSLGAHLTQCGVEHANLALLWCLERGLLSEMNDEVRAGP